MKLVKIGVTTIVISFAVVAAAFGQSVEQKGYEIAKRSSDQDKGYHDYMASGKMTLTNKAGMEATRDFDFKSMESPPGDLSMLVFNWPGDIRDTALLTHQHRSGSDDQWIFLSAERRIKRIAGTGRAGSFVGSEFAYEDMVEQDIDKFTFKWLSAESCCDVVERTPKNNDTGYSRQRVWFDKANNTIAKIEYFNMGGTLVKTMSVTGYQKYQGRFWRPSIMTMVNHLTGKRTTLSWRNYRFSVGLNDNEFTTRALERAR